MSDRDEPGTTEAPQPPHLMGFRVELPVYARLNATARQENEQ